jgi:divalent metal cation (Fe/Co/Zn/Cd) transporter
MEMLCNVISALSGLCAHIVVRVQPDVVKSLKTKELIHKAKSDNTDLFRNFATTIGAIPLTCDVHGAGAFFFLLLFLDL